MLAAQESNIRVMCRFRPQNSRELKEGGEIVVDFPDPATVNVLSKEYPGMFSFDRIFDWEATQEQVYNHAAKAIIDGESFDVRNRRLTTCRCHERIQRHDFRLWTGIY